jgi:hypothetical protein
LDLQVTKAVAKGDLSKKIEVDARGEIADLANTVNNMCAARPTSASGSDGPYRVDQLRLFSSEVTRVALEVGTEGELGGQAVIPDVSGTWKVHRLLLSSEYTADRGQTLTDNVNVSFDVLRQTC